MAALESDWRLQGQESYLQGELLYWSQYATSAVTSDHDHCEFCFAKFMEGDFENVLHYGYATHDKYRWICETCFNDFKDRFGWQLSNAKS